MWGRGWGGSQTNGGDGGGQKEPRRRRQQGRAENERNMSEVPAGALGQEGDYG